MFGCCKVQPGLEAEEPGATRPDSKLKNMAKVITVFGATGTQGGGVANALLQDPDFKVRAVTRNASSAKAKALQERGAELVEASYDDPGSLERAMQGAYGTFVVTQINIEHADFDQVEIRHGKAAADAAKAAGVQHVVFSSQDAVKKTMGFPCLEFDSKAEIEAYMRSIELPVTFVKFPAYYDNYLAGLLITKMEDGTYEIGYPLEGAAMDGISTVDAGFAIMTIFKNWAQWIRRTVGFSAGKLTAQQHADIFSKHLAPKVFKPTEMTSDAFSQLPFPGAQHLGDMFKYYRVGNPDRSEELTRQLYPGTRGLDQWMAENKETLLNALS
ncbi:nmrA-like family domain-containing protein 1 [Branchiostoma lanceolatum]|uniref:nmrA-like family domain-containing protein 1 n=1 Tax=Branchiostoma lanceolatum TaxID=7740 RepID=UPI003456B53F